MAKTKKSKPVDYKKITTWENFCKASGTPEEVPIDFSAIPKGLAKFLMANYKLATMFAFLRGDKKFDYRSGNGQYKYYAWWWNVEASAELPSGFGLSRPNAHYAYGFSIVGSRLCLFEREMVIHMMEHFNELYVDLNLIKED